MRMKQQRVNKLGAYVLGQLQELVPNMSRKPVLASINDKSYKVELQFSIGDSKQPVTVSVNDLYLAKLSKKLGESIHASRDEFIKTMYKEVSAGLREDIENEQKFIDFSQPLSEEVMNEAEKLADDFLANPNMEMNTNVEYMLSLGSPLFIYNTIKLILDKMRNKNMILPNAFINAVRDPQNYLNPNVFLERDEVIDEVYSA